MYSLDYKEKSDLINKQEFQAKNNDKNKIDESIDKVKIYDDNKNNNEKNKNMVDTNGIIALNDEELNTLEYENALIIDKRTYCQYYFSLLRKKHLILFTFLPSNDYNLIFIKISLLLLSFSLYFTINAFFFTDETMHKITVDHGNFDFIYQIPQILYSTVISAIINMILKKLSLSESQILSIKKEKDYESALNKGKSILNCLKIKFIIFFLLCF